MSRWLLFLICPAFTGCVAFAYPSYQITPEIDLKEAAPEVRAFKFTRENGFFGATIAGAITMQNDVAQLDISKGKVEAQDQFAFQHMFWSLIWSDSHHSDFDLCLYRPGYEAVEVSPRPWLFGLWNQPMQVTWKQATSFKSELQAIDRFERGEYLGMRSEHLARRPEARQFLAAEYERLAHHPDCPNPSELLEKATKYREAGFISIEVRRDLSAQASP